MLIHPTVERLRGLGLTAMADAFIEMQNNSAADDLSREDWLGLLVDREATSRENKRLARRLRHARLRQTAVVEDVDFRAPRGLDRALFQKLATCQLGPRQSPSGDRRPDRHRQVMVGLRTRPQGLPRGLLGALQARPAPVRRPRPGARRGPAGAADDDARTHPPADHRRLGAGAAERRAASRPAGDRRRPLREGLAADHQPGPGRVAGTRSSAIPPSATRSWTASFTAPIASS